MAHQAVRFVYPNREIPIILKSIYREDEYFGADSFESRRIKIILAKYKSRHSLHSLPGTTSADLYPFKWDRIKQCFQIQMDNKVTVALNTLEAVNLNNLVFERS